MWYAEVIIGSLSTDHGDGGGNVTLKINSRFLKLFRVYSSSPEMLKWANFPGVDFLGTTLKFRKRKKNSSSLVYVLHKTWNSAFSRRSRVETAEKRTRKVWCTCKFVVLLNKAIAFWTFSSQSPSPSLLLKLSNTPRAPANI